MHSDGERGERISGGTNHGAEIEALKREVAMLREDLDDAVRSLLHAHQSEQLRAELLGSLQKRRELRRARVRRDG